MMKYLLVNGDNSQDAVLNASLELDEMRTINPDDFLSFTIFGVASYTKSDKSPITYDFCRQNGGDEFIVAFDMLHT